VYKIYSETLKNARRIVQTDPAGHLIRPYKSVENHSVTCCTDTIDKFDCCLAATERQILREQAKDIPPSNRRFLGHYGLDVTDPCQGITKP
jgi:hypothetical protein